MSRAREVANFGSTGVTSAELDKLDGFTGTADDLNYAKDLRATGVTNTEFDYLDGVGSNLQTQLNAKQATITTGISNTNVLVANANLADDDFLRVDGTAIEGRSASEMLAHLGSGTPGSGNFLRGDGSWAAVSGSNLTNFQFQTALDSQVSETGQTFVTKATNTFTVTAGRKILVTTFCNDLFVNSNASYAEWQLSISDGTTTNTEKVQMRWLTASNYVQQATLACTIASSASTTITVLQQLRSLDSGYTATMGSTVGVANNVHCYEFSS